MFRSFRHQGRRQLAGRWAVLAVLLFGFLPASGMAAPAVPATAGAIVRPDPLVSTVPVGGTFTVTLYVEDVQGLYGVDVRLSFDTAILQVVDAAPATAGIQIAPLNTFLQPDFVVRRKACNGVDPTDADCTGPGLVWYAATQVSPSEAVSGSGPLAAVTFRRIQPGDTVLKVIHHELVTRQGGSIPSETRDGLVVMPTQTSQRVLLPLVFR